MSAAVGLVTRSPAELDETARLVRAGGRAVAHAVDVADPL